MTPGQRANYLAWLAGGRKDELDDIGYAFVYFYGLERRALVDDADIETVLTQANRLMFSYRTMLVDAIALIDKTKRDIKAQIHSAAITAKAEQCSIDQVWLRRAKDKIDHLTREREEVRRALGDVNRRIKDRRVASHGRPRETFAEAFMRLAKARLLPEVYEDLVQDAKDASGTDG